MKKILLIGKFNSVFQDIHDELVKWYNVQVCVDNLDIIRGMLKLNMPDAVIISLIAMERDSDTIMRELKFYYQNIPVICIGTEAEQTHFMEFFEGGQFQVLTRPISNSEIVAAINKVVVSSDTVCAEQMEREKQPEEPMTQKKVVLLVDDNAMQLRTLNRVLSEKYEVQMATSGMKALTLIGRKLPDIIFLDYEMPMCDGKMTLRMIREIEEAKDIPVVFLTGMNDRAHIESVLELRPAGYLIKPASSEKLFETIEKILGE